MIKKILVLLGLPGSGKGTQGSILAGELGIPHISTGDIFRKMAHSDSTESELLNEYMNSGKLVPSDLVNKIVKKFLLSDECKSGCVLDGYPRNLEQAKFLTKNVEAKINAIFFDVEEEIVVKRILGRYNCSSCTALYNKYFDNPKIDGICDICGGSEFSSRLDDDENTVLLRIEEYTRETQPLVEYYKNNSSFFVVNAGKNKEEVINEISLIAKKV